MVRITVVLIDTESRSLANDSSVCCPVQIYVEIERARLTKTLASIKEQSGEIKEAASILQELQVSLISSCSS